MSLGLTAYTFIIDPSGYTAIHEALTEKEERAEFWASLSEEAKNACASIECIDEQPAWAVTGSFATGRCRVARYHGQRREWMESSSGKPLTFAGYDEAKAAIRMAYANAAHGETTLRLKNGSTVTFSGDMEGRLTSHLPIDFGEGPA